MRKILFIIFIPVLFICGCDFSNPSQEDENTKPVANAGVDQTVFVGNIVQLDGSSSSDADDDTLTYNWSITSTPDGSTSTLSDSAIVNPTLTSDVAGEYTIQLVVNDGNEDSVADSVVIIVNISNTKPIANAGADQTVTLGETVQLDGSGSSDADGDSLTYSWSITSAPSGSTASLYDATVINLTFVADLAGTYTIQLFVNDGIDDSNPDIVTITATEPVPNTWTKISENVPFIPERSAYAGNNKLVLFGGNHGFPGVTYEYNTGKYTWLNVTELSINRPLARQNPSLIYIGNSKVLLFGGTYDDENMLNDTWEYDVITHSWTEINTVGVRPPERQLHMMAYGGNSTAILFSGEGYDDTWEYDTVTHTWSKISIIGDNPLPRFAHSMAYAGNSKIILFGGMIWGGGIIPYFANDTWEYDVISQTWGKITGINNSPSARQGAGISYIGDGKVILFGGNYDDLTNDIYYSDTWMYDINTHNWTEMTALSPNNPPSRWSHYMTMEYIGQGKLLLFDNNIWMYSAGDLTNEMDL